MTKTGKIALVVYTALFFLVTKVRQVINGLQFRFNGLQLLSTDMIRFAVLLRNPLPFGVTIDAIQGDVYVQGQRVSNYAHDVDLQLPIEIKPSSITPVNLDVYVDFNNLSQAVYDNILSGDIRTFTAQFVGTVTVGGKSIPVSKTISYYDLV